MKSKIVPKFVLTGGPCSGKTTSIAYLTEKLSDYGFTVFVVPETATLITQCGIDRKRMKDPHQLLTYEEAILDLQLILEERVERAIHETFEAIKPIMLLDRGVMDVKAFLPEGYEKEFERMLRKRNLTPQSAKDRYMGVIHLITCAEGKEEYYTLEGNPARLETPEVARKIDHRIRHAWLGHPNLKIIGNEGDFQEKIRRAFAYISKMSGIPVAGETTRKYLLEGVDFRSLPRHEKVEIEELYLRCRRKDGQLRLKRRKQRGSYMYFVVRRQSITEEAGYIEVEQMINEEDYLRMSRMIDKNRLPLKKIRYSFLWEDRYFSLDVYVYPPSNLKILSVDMPESDGKVVIPNFIHVKEEITSNPLFEEENFFLRQPRLL